jgi:hypothetical protein
MEPPHLEEHINPQQMPDPHWCSVHQAMHLKVAESLENGRARKNSFLRVYVTTSRD